MNFINTKTYYYNFNIQIKLFRNVVIPQLNFFGLLITENAGH